MFLYGGAGLLLLGLWIFCLLDVITTDEYECRNLPKGLWLVIVLFLPDVGSIAWLIAGRPQPAARPGGRPYNRPYNLPYKGNTGRFPEYDRPGRAVAANPDDDEEFLRQCRDRAEQQRRTYRDQQRAKLERDEED